MARPQDQIVETGREARQGYRDRPVLGVLVLSLVLALIVLALVWVGFFAR
ncbi:MAG: hypothetical protein QOD74_2791 [Variibacter sp.]|jgi:hypothetical protein|nr:hypothetical protein [Variibacter sp.]